jgi:hypothetical protein
MRTETQSDDHATDATQLWYFGSVAVVRLMTFYDEKRQTFDFLHACARPPFGRLVTTDDVDAKLALEKLPQLIRDEFHRHNRLRGNQRKASYFVLKRVLTGKPISERELIEKFGVEPEHVRFVVDYVTVRVRLAIEALSEEIKRWRFIEDWRDLYTLYEPIRTD